MDKDADVLIVGAGPTGLLLAGDLARAGVRCTVLERRTEQSNLTKAFAVHARTLELLDARGVADELVATGARVGGLTAFGCLDVDLSRLPTRFPFVLVTPQYHTERVLADLARESGAVVEAGAEVVGLRQSAGAVTVEVAGAAGRSALTAPYVVGADGVGSTVRTSLGLRFPGRSAVQSVMLADVRLTDPPPDVLTADGRGDGFAFLAPFGDGWYRAITWNRHRQLPDDAGVTLDEIRAITRSVLGSDFGMHDPRWMSRFHSDERQVARYRTGRVFLAGDAAHVHSPAGGQGMNTGLQDAANLGWKLAAVVTGQAPDALLDTYHTERYPVGRAVLRGSGALLRLALARSPITRAVRGLLRATAGRFGLVPPQAARAVSGLAISYPSARGEHGLVGKRAPDVPLAHGGQGPTRLYEALRAGRFVLLGRDREPPPVDGWSDRVRPAVVRSLPASAILIRPDGYVAWATDQAAPDHGDPTLTAALVRWAGPPREPAKNSRLGQAT